MRRRPAALSLFVVVLVGGGARPARAECEHQDPPRTFDGPVAIGFENADFATGRHACPRTEIGLGARAGAVIDTPGFYGALNADALLSASYAFLRRWEAFATLEVVHWQFAQNATIKATSTNLGQLTVGAAAVAWSRDRWVLTPYARLLLPTSSATPYAPVLGGEVGLAAQFRPREKVALHGYVGADLSGAASAALPVVRGGVLVDVGVQYSPWSWLGLVLDLNLQLGHRASLDLFAPSVALRFRLWRQLDAELSAIVPVAGADRQLVAFALRIQYRF